MNGIVWVKKDKLTTYGEQRLQRINAGREDHHPSKRPFQVAGLRDLSRDLAIKEPYWGPLAFVHDM